MRGGQSMALCSMAASMPSTQHRSRTRSTVTPRHAYTPRRPLRPSVPRRP
jgi:hypothetical protein